ncbi:MAG TPA: LamG domain-containing protein, partial [Pseudobdellovibrionaceae bacterium]|nr:LamG domain-containing protein [Pseudobdellovibrionaceae bacterium]
MMSMTHDNLMNLTNSLSISAWIKLDSYAAGYATHPITKFHAITNSPFTFYVFGSVDSAGNPCPSCPGIARFMATAGGAWVTISGTYKLALGQWYHVGLSYDAALGGQLYINGEKIEGRAGSGTLANNTMPLRLFGNGAANQFGGSLDEVAIWNASLSDQDMKLIYDRQSAKYAGEYQSPVIDLGASGDWTGLSASTPLPFFKGLPASSGSESGSDYSAVSPNL